MSNECLRQTYKCYSRENKCNDEDGSLKEGELMALGCNPAWQVNNVQEGFAEYLSNKSCRREYFMTCPRLPHYHFSFPFQLLQFLVRFFLLDVTPNFLQISRFTDNGRSPLYICWIPPPECLLKCLFVCYVNWSNCLSIGFGNSIGLH